jgi:hypothetical protein
MRLSAHGNPARIGVKVREHLVAGADQVALLLASAATLRRAWTNSSKLPWLVLFRPRLAVRAALDRRLEHSRNGRRIQLQGIGHVQLTGVGDHIVQDGL